MAPKLKNSFVLDQVTVGDTEENIRAYYEHADITDIQAELRTQGIDPTPTIVGVNKLVVENKRARDPKRR